MLDLSGMTFAQKLHTLKWHETPPRGRSPQYYSNTSPKRLEGNAARKARNYDPNDPYWVISVGIKERGGSLKEAWEAAEEWEVKNKGCKRFASDRSWHGMYRRFKLYQEGKL